MRCATFLVGAALVLAACSGKQAAEARQPDDCAGVREPTPEESQKHMETFGCPPCPCACVNGRIKCASCPPCDSFEDPLLRPKEPGTEADAGAETPD